MVLPEELKAIGEGVMKNLPALKTLTAHGVTTIERLGLSGFHNLKKAILPALTDIKSPEGFTGCEKLASLTIGATLPTVGNTAFREATPPIPKTYKYPRIRQPGRCREASMTDF